MEELMILMGPADAEFTDSVFGKIKDAMVEDRLKGILLLTPDTMLSDAVRSLCETAGDAHSRCVLPLTFHQLAQKVISERGIPARLMTRGERMLATAHAYLDVADQMSIFRQKTITASMMSTLAEGMLELKRAGASPDSLRQAAAQYGNQTLAAKFSDLALLLEQSGKIHPKHLLDDAEFLQLLAEELPASSYGAYRFFLYGFTDFSAAEKKVIETLAHRGASITLFVPCVDDSASPVFTLAKETCRWFQSLGTAVSRPVRLEQIHESSKKNNASILSESAFDAVGPETEADGTVTITTAKDKEEECELAAAQIAALAQDGCHYREIAVAVPSMKNYRTALENAFAAFQIPVSLPGGPAFMQMDLPRLISSVLEAVVYDYETDAMLTYLKTGLSPLETDGCDRLEEYLFTWQIHGAMWKSDWTMNPNGYQQASQNPETAAKVQQMLEGMNKQRRQVMEPLSALEERLRSACNGAVQVSALYQFMADISLVDRLEKQIRALERSGRHDDAVRRIHLWDSVCTAMEQFVDILGDRALGAEQFANLFTGLLACCTVSGKPAPLDAVTVDNIDHLRGKNVRHLFVLGCTNDAIPGPTMPGTVFSLEERAAMAAAKEADGESGSLTIPVDDINRRLYRQYSGLYTCLAASENLHLSWPQINGEGKPNGKSLLISRAEKLFRSSRSGMAGDDTVMSPLLSWSEKLFALKTDRPDEEKTDQLDLARTFSPAASLAMALQSRAGNSSRLYALVQAAYKSRGYEPFLAAMTEAGRREAENLKLKSVRALYGESPVLTPSRAEAFRLCPYAYFLDKGLRARAWEPARFDGRAGGTLIHAVLESVFRSVTGGEGVRNTTREEVDALADRAFDQFIHEVLQDFRECTPRFRILFQQRRRIVRQACEEVWEELCASQFVPRGFEVDLSGPAFGDAKPGLTGRIDRVDAWQDGDTIYYRVVDYKSGEAKFSLADVCCGINMQMLFYLSALQSTFPADSEHPGKKLQPAGVLYIPLRHTIQRSGKERMEAEKAKASGIEPNKRSGLLLDNESVIRAMEETEGNKKFLPIGYNKDGSYNAKSKESLVPQERLDQLSRFVVLVQSDILQEIASGAIRPYPYKSTQKDACQYCDYHDACPFDQERGERHTPTKCSLKQLWDLIEQRVQAESL